MTIPGIRNMTVATIRNRLHTGETKNGRGTSHRADWSHVGRFEAEPLTDAERVQRYQAQIGRAQMTPRQSRRYGHKVRKAGGRLRAALRG